MFRKTVSAIMLLLLIVSTLTLAFKIQLAKADSGTIYISPYGVFPPTAPISTTDNITYTLTGNIINGSIFVEKDNIIINGAGYTVQGTNADLSKAIDVNGNNVTIENTNIQAVGVGGFGIFIEFGYSNDTISGNNIMNISYMGIVLSNSSNDNIIGNNFMNNWDGIDIDQSSSNNTITGNNIVNSGYIAVIFGIYSSNNLVTGNYVVNDSMGIYFDCSSNNTVTMNDMMESNESFYIFSYPTVEEGISANNTIYDNNFVNNVGEVYSIDSTTFWDNGTRGNYWSEYNGTDTNHDGIGDTPYYMGANNTDNFPLMSPYMRVVGDLNADGKINLQDLQLLANAYGSKPSDPNWNPLADLAPPYGVISLTDLVTLAVHYGEHNP